MSGNLGSSDDNFADVGDVDMFGLDEFGAPTSSELIGSIVGTGTATLASILVRQVAKPGSTMTKYSEGIGGLVGAVAGGIMYAVGGNARAMAIPAIANALVGNGLRQIEQMFLAPKAGEMNGVVIDPTGAIKPGLGIHAIEPGYAVPASGLGIHAIEPGYAVPASGLGEVAIDPAFPVPGSVHAGLAAARPELVGASDYSMSNVPGAAQNKLLGGPSVSALGAHYGATLFGNG